MDRRAQGARVRRSSLVAALALVACAPAPAPVVAPRAAPPSAPEPIACESQGDDAPVDPKDGDPVALVCARGGSEASNRRVEADLATKPGPFHAGVIADDLRKLYAGGLFSDLEVVAAHTPRGYVLRFLAKPRPLVAHVEIRGATAVGEDRVAELAGARAGLPYDPSKTRAGRLRLEEAYKDEGYPYATVALDAEGADDVKVEIAIDEGPLVRVGGFVVSGASKAVEADLRKRIALLPGTIFRPIALEHDVLIVSAACYDHGLLEAKVGEPTKVSSPDRALLTITVPLVEGPVYRVKSIVLVGDVDDERAYRAMLPLKSGDVFSRGVVAAAIEKMSERRKLYGKSTEVEPSVELDAKAHKVTVAIRFLPK